MLWLKDKWINALEENDSQNIKLKSPSSFRVVLLCSLHRYLCLYLSLTGFRSMTLLLSKKFQRALTLFKRTLTRIYFYSISCSFLEIFLNPEHQSPEQASHRPVPALSIARFWCYNFYIADAPTPARGQKTRTRSPEVSESQICNKQKIATEQDCFHSTKRSTSISTRKTF